MRVRWIGTGVIVDGRLRETGAIYDDFSPRIAEELCGRGCCVPVAEPAETASTGRAHSPAPEPPAAAPELAPTTKPRRVRDEE